MAHLPFWATNVDTNTDRVTTFLAAHPGTFFCNACLSIEVPVPKPIKVNQLIRALHGVNPYRSGRVVCFSCGEVRECIAYGSSVQVTRAQARQLGATARKRGRPIYENPCRGKLFEAWRKGWQGPGAADTSRSPFRRGSFPAELYDYLVRHDQDVGLTAREITDGLVERDSATVNSGLYHLYRRGFVRRLLPFVTGQRLPPQRYRAVPIPPEE